MRLAFGAGLLVVVVGCDHAREKNTDAPPVGAVAAAVVSAMAPLGPGEKRCVVHLHGKSGKGGPTTVADGITHLRPNGNAPGWGGLEWKYFPDAGYDEVRTIVATTVAASSCTRVILHGFSNGGGAAAKLYCRGERFGATAVGYVLDDPVPDHAVENCAPPPGVKLKVYWTGGLRDAVDGWSCGAADWTCEGDSTIGIDRYTKLLGVTRAPSIHTKHEEYASPPEEFAWW